MIVELKSIQDAFKTASSISKTILGFKIAVEVKNEILNLMNSLIEAQSETLSIQEKIGELEREKNFALAELDRISRWQEEERQKYEMCQITPGQIVYRYIDSNEPRHFICPECFRNNIKSLMNNPAGVGAAASTFICINKNCNYSIAIAPVPYREKIRPWLEGSKEIVF